MILNANEPSAYAVVGVPLIFLTAAAIEYDSIALTDETLAAATLDSVALAAATLTNVTLEPD